MSETPVVSTPSETSSNTSETPSQDSSDTGAKQEVKSEQSQENKALKEELRKFKIKIDDQEQEVEETELIRGYQKAKAADKRFQEAAKLRKESDALIKLLREDPARALSHPSIGHDMQKLAEEILAKKIEEEMLSPEQRELKKYKEELETLKKADEERKAELERNRLDELTAHYEQEYTKKITEALEISGLPKTNHTIRRMAYYMNEALDRGYNELEPKDVVELVRNDYLRDIKDLLGASDGQVLMELLGDDVAKKIRKFDLDKLKTVVQPEQKQSSKEPSPQKEKKKMTMDEFNEYMKAIKNS